MLKLPRYHDIFFTSTITLFMYTDKVKQQKRENEGTLVVLGIHDKFLSINGYPCFSQRLFVGVSIQ